MHSPENCCRDLKMSVDVSDVLLFKAPMLKVLRGCLNDPVVGEEKSAPCTLTTAWMRELLCLLKSVTILTLNVLKDQT